MSNELPPDMSQTTAPPTPLEERWAILERVCDSTHLKRSAKLRELLKYLCHRAWVEGAHEIREQEIGVRVFGRSEGYDSAQDTLVRVQASQLRKRLARYFEEEGAHEDPILEIPRGSYIPLLSPRISAEPLEPGVPPSTVSKADWRIPVLIAACLVLAGLSIWLAFRPLQPGIEGETLRRFWSAFAPAGSQTTVVVADSTFSALQDMLHRPILLDEYTARSYRGELENPAHSPEMKRVLAYLMERRYTSLADVMLVRRLWVSGVLDPARTSVVYSRDLNLRTLQKGNIIYTGSRRAIPWVDLLESKLDFHFIYDERSREIVVENRRPKAGEPAQFHVTNSAIGGAIDRFAVVALLPAPSGGNILLLSGQEMSGTEAAANLVTTDASLREVLQRLPATEGGTPYFEALLKVRHVEYTTQGFEVLAVHPH